MCFTNDIAARSFLALDVCEGVAGLMDIVSSLDRILIQYKQPTYYQVRLAVDDEAGLNHPTSPESHSTPPHQERARRDDTPLLQPPHFHASVCWWANGEGLGQEQLAAIQQLIDEADLDTTDLWVSSVSCKIGDKLYAFSLAH